MTEKAMRKPSPSMSGGGIRQYRADDRNGRKRLPGL